MKRIFAWITVAVMVCTSFYTVSAEDMEVQIITSPDEGESSSVDLEDFKLGETAEIEGFGDVTISKADILDEIVFLHIDITKSGLDAEYLCLQVDILNEQKKPADFYKMIGNITANFGDGYQFSGWKRQYAEPQLDGDLYCYKDPEESYEIDPLYKGRYLIAVTLPNYVIESEEPLSVSFSIGDNNFTYYHRR